VQSRSNRPAVPSSRAVPHRFRGAGDPDASRLPGPLGRGQSAPTLPRVAGQQTTRRVGLESNVDPPAEGAPGTFRRGRPQQIPNRMDPRQPARTGYIWKEGIRRFPW
jgi:hypothetical protein